MPFKNFVQYFFFCGTKYNMYVYLFMLCITKIMSHILRFCLCIPWRSYLQFILCYATFICSKKYVMKYITQRCQPTVDGYPIISWYDTIVYWLKQTTQYLTELTSKPQRFMALALFQREMLELQHFYANDVGFWVPCQAQQTPATPTRN